MLFHVEIAINVPHDADQEQIKALSAREVDRVQGLQRDGKWLHIWRVAGKWANISILDVNDADELHQILSALPLFPFMDITVKALCRHPASIEGADARPVPNVAS